MVTELGPSCSHTALHSEGLVLDVNHITGLLTRLVVALFNRSELVLAQRVKQVGGVVPEKAEPARDELLKDSPERSQREVLPR